MLFAIRSPQFEVENEVEVELNRVQHAVDYTRRKVEGDGVVG